MILVNHIQIHRIYHNNGINVCKIWSNDMACNSYENDIIMLEWIGNPEFHYWRQIAS